MRVLLVEDEKKLAQTIVSRLTLEGFDVNCAHEGIEAMKLVSDIAYDLAILDIGLPRLSGTKILEKIRSRDVSLPIMMLTAQDAPEEKVRHLEQGADDYLTKPFSYDELVARIKALLRRRSDQKPDVIRFKDFELDRLTHRIKRNQERIELSNKEYALLDYLAVNAGHVLSRNMIVEHVWGYSFDSVANIVEVYIRQLRNKIDKDHDVKLIHTIRGRGYAFGDEVE